MKKGAPCHSMKTKDRCKVPPIVGKNRPANGCHIYRWWFQILFIFTPKFGGDEPILTSIFFNGFGSTTNKLSLTPGFLFKDEIVLLKLVPSFRGHVVSLLGGLFLKNARPPKFNSSPLTSSLRNRKGLSSKHHFSGGYVLTSGGVSPFKHGRLLWEYLYYVKQIVQRRGVSWGGVLQT